MNLLERNQQATWIVLANNFKSRSVAMRFLIGFIFVWIASVSNASNGGGADFANLYEDHINSVVTIYLSLIHI